MSSFTHMGKQTMCGAILFRRIFILGLLFVAMPSYAECVDPITTPTECIFKREDTHLAVLQPSYYFAKEDKVDELISQGESFIENYYSSVKTTGDAATRFMIAPTAAAMTIVEVTEAANIAIVLANDPWNLKTIYADIVCEFWFDFAQDIFATLLGPLLGNPPDVESVDRDCPGTSELLQDTRKLAELDRVRQEITDIIFNPNLTLGEEWSGSIAEIEAIRERLRSLDTFGRNIATTEMNHFYDERYPSLATLVAAPNETTAQLATRVGELNNSRNNTIREHMMATHQNLANLRAKDQVELERLSDMSSRSVGRMQGTEIDNMLQMQGVQNIQMMAEELMNRNTLIMQDMADTHGAATRKSAVAIKSAEPILEHEAVLGNGRGFRL